MRRHAQQLTPTIRVIVARFRHIRVILRLNQTRRPRHHRRPRHYRLMMTTMMKIVALMKLCVLRMDGQIVEARPRMRRRVDVDIRITRVIHRHRRIIPAISKLNPTERARFTSRPNLRITF